MQVRLLVAGVALLTACACHSSSGQDNSAMSLSLARLDLSDGHVWIRGAGKSGRPFPVRVVLVNRGSSPLRIPDFRDPNGLKCLTFALVGPDNLRTELRSPAAAFSGVPGTMTIAPGQSAVLEVDLVRWSTGREFPAGRYTMTAYYVNKPVDSPFLKGLWTGSIESGPEQVEIVSPAHGAPSAPR